jgi:hypothetical protein
MLAGETDFLLRIVAADWDSYQRFLTTRLTAAPNVSHVKSALGIRSCKTAPGVPIELEYAARGRAPRAYLNATRTIRRTSSRSA